MPPTTRRVFEIAADVAVIDLQSGDFTLKDGGGKEFKSTQRLRPVFTFKDGRILVKNALPSKLSGAEV